MSASIHTMERLNPSTQPLIAQCPTALVDRTRPCARERQDLCWDNVCVSDAVHVSVPHTPSGSTTPTPSIVQLYLADPTQPLCVARQCNQITPISSCFRRRPRPPHGPVVLLYRHRFRHNLFNVLTHITTLCFWG